jgi:uncharacterized membrane protein YphA (DoxX/SURF4 family)
MAPFGLPWPTFSAILVILASVVIAVVWAVGVRDDDGKGDGRE